MDTSHVPGSTLLLVGRVLSIGINLVSQALIARHLSQSDFGAFAMAFSIASVGQVFITLGLHRGATQFFARYEEAGDHRRLVGTILFNLAVIVALGSELVLGVALAQGALTSNGLLDPTATGSSRRSASSWIGSPRSLPPDGSDKAAPRDGAGHTRSDGRDPQSRATDDADRGGTCQARGDDTRADPALAEIGVLRPDAAGRCPVIERDGDYFGRTVNLASRLSGIAGPGEIVTDATTADALEPTDAAPLGTVEVKGLPTPIPLFRLRS